MTRGIFVTGTDTEVGKTIVTRAIVRAAVRRGRSVSALKPVESGVPKVNGAWAPMDATALLAASARDFAISEICPYMFPDPVSPHLAARRVGGSIVSEPILDLLEDHRGRSDLVIAEGAGGLLVPLSDDLLYADLIARTGFELLVVAPNVLGTINATLGTLEAASARGIKVLGVVLNKTPAADLGNGEAIARHGKVEILGEFPTLDGNDDELASAAESALDLDRILGA